MAYKKMHAALFDLDGVLIDTEPAYTRIWQDIERKYPTGIENFAYKIKGTTLENILSTYFPDLEVQLAVRRMLAEREEAMEYELFDGVMDFLHKLKEEDIPCAIVTSSGDAKMERLFRAKPDFAACFDEVITDGRVTRSKPDPEGYILAARSLGAEPEDCYVFEDSYNGLKAGRAAGATVVALSTSNPAEKLKPLADIVVASLNEVEIR